jgi:hypothetical protein
VCYLKEHYRRQKNVFFFQVKTRKEREKREMWEEKKMKKNGCPSHAILESQNVLLNYDALPCTWALHYTSQFYYFYLGLIKQCFYLVLNIWYLFNLVPYFISPEPNEGPTSGKEREGKRERWRPNWISPLWPCS